MSALLRLPAVRARTALSRAQIYKLIRRGKIPAQVKLGPGVAAWVEAEIEKWIADRISERGGAKEGHGK